ncbi:MAG: ribosomal-protein-alanine N-acetyltransferase [Pseudomonadota bacterium]|jgi:ribosomal-protein-alanine N-acetyltransferase
MNPVLKPAEPVSQAAALQFSSMRVSDVDEVTRIENDAYPFPWTRGNFLDSLDSGYDAWVLRESGERLVGYFLLMPVVDEMHLLNITVRPDVQGQGLGSRLMGKVRERAAAAGMASILLEVRPSNELALAVYRHIGFEQIGVRKNYYPAAAGSREDAIVMRLPLGDAPRKDQHGEGR